MAYEPHLVRQGEYLSLLAHRRGADPDEVWQHDKNAQLREARMSRDVLLPGDVVWLPIREQRKHALAVSSSNTFHVVVPRNRIRVVFRNGEEPVANAPYVIHGLGPKPLEGVSDGEGAVAFDAPYSVTQVTLTFVALQRRHVVRIGHLDPIESPSGVKQRLQHLGYYGWIVAPRPSDPAVIDSDERDARAVRAFQEKVGLAPTGEVDDAMRAALLDAHGS